jgi:hypothetical protein
MYVRVGGATVTLEGKQLQAVLGSLGSGASGFFTIPNPQRGTVMYTLSWKGNGGGRGAQWRRDPRITVWVEHGEDATMVEAAATRPWADFCREVQTELTITGLWHLEDIYGRTVRGTAELHDGERYQVREMADLTRDM